MFLEIKSLGFNKKIMKHRSDLDCCVNKKIPNYLCKVVEYSNKILRQWIIYVAEVSLNFKLKINHTLNKFSFECFVKCSCILPFLDVWLHFVSYLKFQFNFNRFSINIYHFNSLLFTLSMLNNVQFHEFNTWNCL